MKEEKIEWIYSRNQRRHTLLDNHGNERYGIRSLAPDYEVQGRHGYGLSLPDRNEMLFRSLNVATLKRLAEGRVNP